MTGADGGEGAEPSRWLDERGRRCPAPVIALARAAAAAPPGTVLAVLSDDAAAETDVPAWARLRGATWLGAVDAPDGRGGRAHIVRTAESPSDAGPSARPTGQNAAGSPSATGSACR